MCTLWQADALEKSSSIISTAIQSSLSAFGYGHVKPAQADAVEAALGRVRLRVHRLRKSLVHLCVQAFLLDGLRKEAPQKPCVLVVSPLVARPG